MIFSLTFGSIFGQIIQKHRVIILTDIEADPDDTQSLVRLLLYTNEIDITGLVATTSCWLKSEVNPESINRVIGAYAEIHQNLLKHDTDFPASEQLLQLVKQGLPEYGILGVGDGKDSEGSNWIIQELEKDDDRPLWISVWGGVNTLAQALYKIEHTKSAEEAKALISKLRVYTISDQEAGSYNKAIKLGPPENSHRIHGTAPEVEKEETIHIILKVTDKGEPQLSGYKRIIVTTIPK